MTRQITSTATLNPTAGTLDLSAIAGFDVRRLKVVLDAKTGAMIYGPVPGFGYSALTSGVMTLQAVVSALSASDPLIVMYDDSTGKAAEDGTDITAATMPSGGAGLRGWLSAIHTKLTGTVAVSVASVPLAPGAAQDGTDITAATMPPGGTGQRGWLSAIYAKLTGTVSISATALPLPAGAAQDATLGQAVTALGSILTALGLLGTDADVQATTAKVEAVRALLAGAIKVDPSAVTTPISAVGLPLPAGAATESTLAAMKSILAAQASIAESTWFDPTVTPNVFYFRRVTNTDGVVTEIFTDPNGTQVAFNANWKPLGSTSSYQVLPAVSYDTATAFTGASKDDVIVRVIVLNLGVSPATIAASMWLNANTGAVLSSVTMANLKEVTRDIAIPDGYFATFGAMADAAVANPAAAGTFMATFRGFWTNWLTRVPVLGTALMAGSTPVTLATDDKAALVLGAVADVAATADAGSFSLPALLKRGLANWTTYLQRVPVLGAALAAASTPVALATDQLSKLAQDGTDATGAIQVTGGVGIRGWLSGLLLGVGKQADTPATAPTGTWSLIAGLGGLWATVGTTADTAATSDAGAFSFIAFVKRMLGNDTTAFVKITAAETREGALPATLPEPFGTGGSGKLGALGFVWAYTKASAASLVSLLALWTAKSATGTLGAANASASISGGPYGAVGFKLVGTSVQTLSAFGTRDGTTFDVPLSLITEVASPASSTSGQTLAISGAGPFFGYVEAAGCIGVALVTTTYTSGSLAATLTATPTSRSFRGRAPATDPMFVGLSSGGAINAVGNPIFAAWSFNGAAVTDSNAPSVRTAPAGVGALLQAPSGSTNGTPLTNAGAMPAGAKAALLIIPPGGEIDLAIAAAQPSAAPFSVPYPNPTGVTLEVPVELNGMLAFVTVNNAGTVNSVSKPCGLRWI